jgi:uncharacterized protein with PIN domain
MSKCLTDENVTPVLARALRTAGTDAVTPWDVGLDGREDTELAEFALRERRWILTNDQDFVILAREAQQTGAVFPSVIFWEQRPLPRIGWLVQEIAAILGAATDADDTGLLIFL